LGNESIWGNRLNYPKFYFPKDIPQTESTERSDYRLTVQVYKLTKIKLYRIGGLNKAKIPEALLQGFFIAGKKVGYSNPILHQRGR